MQNTFMMEELASNGYVVASPDHTYDAALTVMTDGRVIFHDEDAIFPKDKSRSDSNRRLVDIRQEDLLSIIDQFEIMNDEGDSRFANRFDLNKIGFTGHSAGGGTVLAACVEDARCDAAIALDSWVQPILGDQPINKIDIPVLYLNSPEWLGQENKEGGKGLALGASAPSVMVTIQGAGHNDFTDIPLLSPLARLLGLAGTIDTQIAHQLINEYSLAFLEHILRAETNTLDDLSLPFHQEATVETYQP